MKELNNTELWDLIKNNQTDKQILKRGFETFDIDTTKQNTNAMITLALKSFSKP
jgi:hypothetical protein